MTNVSHHRLPRNPMSTMSHRSPRWMYRTTFASSLIIHEGNIVAEIRTTSGPAFTTRCWRPWWCPHAETNLRNVDMPTSEIFIIQFECYVRGCWARKGPRRFFLYLFESRGTKSFIMYEHTTLNIRTHAKNISSAVTMPPHVTYRCSQNGSPMPSSHGPMKSAYIHSRKHNVGLEVRIRQNIAHANLVESAKTCSGKINEVADKTELYDILLLSVAQTKYSKAMYHMVI